MRTWGMIPVLCGAAADALNYLRDGGNIDVGLVDSLLPEDGDLRVLQELHRHTAPAVLLTPLGRRYTEPQRQRATLVSKPIKASQLYETLLQLLVGRRPPESREPARAAASSTPPWASASRCASSPSRTTPPTKSSSS
jgi:CheY-like chemotaxis protein